MRTVVQVVIVAVSLLMVGGLVLAGMVKVREAANRAQCQNSLKQIGLALHNYCSANEGSIPSARIPNPDLSPDKRQSWQVTLLPYYEANDLYSRMDHAKGWDADENRFLALTRLWNLQCPAFPDRPPESVFIPAHYVGITGLGEEAVTLPLSDPRAGLFGYDRELRLADIADRASTLMAAAETTRAFGAWTAGGPPTARGLVEDDPPYVGLDRQFGGLHATGANVLFADGTVRFVRESIHPRVLVALATIKGSKGTEPIDDR
jgi:prepilin-type processing-associated H-X9-DG protein